MAFNWAGGNQSPFSPNPLSGWGSEATRPSFGAQPGGSPFTPVSSGGLFQSTTAFGAPTTGGSLFGGQTGFGSGFSGFGAQSSGGLFQQPQSTAAAFAPSAFGGFGAQPAQQASQIHSWTMQPQPLQLPSQNPFRDEFYRAVKRRDGRPVTHHTRLDELEENGQNAIRMMQQEQANYEAIFIEISTVPWFKKDASDDLKKVFEDEVAGVTASMKEHRLNVDSFARELLKAAPGRDRIDRAIRDAEYLANDIEKLAHAQDEVHPSVSCLMEGRLYATELRYQYEAVMPHPFIHKKAMEFRPRIEKLLRQAKDMDCLVNNGNGHPLTSGGDLETFKYVHRLISLMKDKLDSLLQKVENHKELFRADRRRRGDQLDPFARSREEEEIREREMHYNWHQHRIPVLQPTTQPLSALQGGPFFSNQGTTPQLSFGVSSGSAFAPQVSSGGFFSTPATQPSSIFGQAPTSQPTPLFSSQGAAPSAPAFGTTAPASSGGFFGGNVGMGSAFGGGGTSPGFGGQTTFGNPTGAFSPGSSVGTNFGATTFGVSPNRTGNRATGNRSL